MNGYARITAPVVTMFLLGGAPWGWPSAASGQTEASPVDSCWQQFRDRLEGCTVFEEPLRSVCFEGAQDGLEACLRELSEEDKPSDCWDVFELYLEDCDCEPDEPCGEQDVEAASGEGALILLNWCLGDAGEGTLPEWWLEDDGSIVFGAEHTLTVMTRNPAVTGVSFWLVRPGSRDVGEGPLVKLGDAAPDGSLLGVDVWRLNADTTTWPIRGSDRVMLLARADVDDQPAAVSHVTSKVGFDPDDLNRDGAIDILDVLTAAALGLDAERIEEIARRAAGQ